MNITGWAVAIGLTQLPYKIGYSRKSCSKLGVFEIMQFEDVIEIYTRRSIGSLT